MPLLFVLLLLHFSCLVLSQNLSFSFPDFSPNEPSLDVGPKASIQYGALQITFDTGTSSIAPINSSGRISYSQALHFSDPHYNYSASFNTSFDLNIQPLDGGGNDATGGGMAFLLSSHRASQTDAIANSYGKWLGLFNSSLIETPDASVQQLVAIEFDTFKDSFDPDDNHIGIDVNSTVSLLNKSLTPLSVFLNTNATNTSVWIDYDGHAKLLDVYVANATKIKPRESVLSYNIDLSLHLPSQIYVGFAGSTGTTLETHCVLAWNFTSQGIPGRGNGRWKIAVAVGVTAAVLILGALGAIFMVVRHRRATTLSQKWKDLNYGPRNFTYRQLRRATQNFTESSLIGKGGFGEVYRGIMSSDNSMVAVKRISPKSMQGEREFIAEVTTIGRLRHKNLVQLLGWCHDKRGSKLLLVYEYMPNGSLDQWLKGESREEMGWERRYNVMKGLAAGLLYLHEEWEMGVVHRDVKPSNVMLDGQWNAKLGDFGLARLIEGSGEGLKTRNIAGTPGYMAPESIETVVTKEADVYSFGAVAMEVATGRRPSSELSRWLWSLYEEERLLEAADRRLSAYNEAELQRLLFLGIVCCHPVPVHRPSIGQVYHALCSASAPLPPLRPPFSPFLLPSASDDSCIYSSTSVSAPVLSSSSIATLSSIDGMEKPL